MSVGALAYLGIGVESSAGTAAGSVAPADYSPFISETIAATRDDLDSQEIALSWDQRKVYAGIQRVGGQIQVEVHPLTFGYFCRSAFDVTTTYNEGYGTPEGPGATASHTTIRTHRFTTALGQFQVGSGSDLPTLTLEINRGPGINVDSSFYYYNMATNVWELTIEQGQVVRASVDMIGRDFGVAAKTTPALPAAAAYLWHQASVSLDGAGSEIFESLTFRLNNNMNPINRIQPGLRAAQVKRDGFRQVEVNGTLGFDSFAEYDRFRNGSEGQLLIHVQGDLLDTNFYNTLVIDVPRFRYSTHQINVGGPGRIQATFTGRGILDTTSNYALEVFLVNSRTSDYSVNAAA